MSYPAITLYELARTQYADLLREASEQRIRHTPAAGIGCKSSWLPGIFDAIAAFRHYQRVTATRSRRHLWTLHA